jgi:hypothetical protein
VAGDETTVVAGGDVEYIDQGDKWLVIDNRGSVQKRRTLPKSIRDIGVAPTVRASLEQDAEDAAARDEALANADPLVYVPPAESDEDKAAREKAETEAIAKADEQRTAPPEEPEPTPAPKQAPAKKD